jgi:short-subunit dehydrogenase
MRAPIDGGVALITGASSGIGEAIARQLAPRLSAVALVARRKDRLDALAEALRAINSDLSVSVQPCDLIDRDATDSMLAQVKQELGTVDILVNNAGFGDMGMYDRSDWQKQERMIQLNVTALCYLTHRLVGPMVNKGHGGVLNISSGFGMSFLPGFSIYIGTKHFVTGFTESLRCDLGPVGVCVTQSCPGPVETEFEANVGNMTGRGTPSWLQISAERCARDSVRAFDHGAAMVVPGTLMKLLMFVNNLTPRWIHRLLYGPVGAWLRKRQARQGS